MQQPRVSDQSHKAHWAEPDTVPISHAVHEPLSAPDYVSRGPVERRLDCLDDPAAGLVGAVMRQEVGRITCSTISVAFDGVHPYTQRRHYDLPRGYAEPNRKLCAAKVSPP